MDGVDTKTASVVDYVLTRMADVIDVSTSSGYLKDNLPTIEIIF